jgi:hypothetical protein
MKRCATPVSIENEDLTWGRYLGLGLRQLRRAEFEDWVFGKEGWNA